MNLHDLNWRRIFGTAFALAALLAVVGLFRFIDALLGGGI